MRSALRRLFLAIRHLPDRLLHRRRHIAAKRLLAGLESPETILVVCHGNICRSPYLEAVLQRDLPALRISSAGFVGPGRRVPPFSLSVSATRGLDLSRFRSRPLVPASVRDADLVVVMDPRQARYLTSHLRVEPSRIVIAGDLDPTPGATRVIEDPWQQPIEAYVAAFDRLDRCAATLVGHFRRPR
jgi:protein-tyrosine phosphatase